MHLFIIVMLLVMSMEVIIMMNGIRNTQKMVIVNAISAQTVAILSLLAIYYDNNDILDITLFYIILGLGIPLALWSYYLIQSKNRNKQ